MKKKENSMDFKQEKLNRDEWNALEIPTIGREYDIISLIYSCNNDVNNEISNLKTLIGFIKIEESEGIHEFLFEKYFEKICKELYDTINIKKGKKKIKKSNMIRLTNFDKRIKEKKKLLFEFIILDVLKNIKKGKDSHKYIYALNYLLSLKETTCNKYVKQIATRCLSENKEIKHKKYIKKYKDLEKTMKLYQHLNSIKLFNHQKEIITSCNRVGPKLVLYQAPTGTGKTLSPIGLVKNHKIIFVCAAKHIGLQLAKCCISLEIPIAVAFGCKDATDIRLHYFAAKDYKKNRRTGGIFKVDNSVGDKVEIIIADIQSYLPAMYYMMAFNKKEEIIWYWDEPTISLDQEEHAFHEILQKNWKNNLIPNVVLSSATLPKEEEITDFIMGFNQKFNNMSVYNIVSNEYAKTIPIIDSKGYSVLPHDIFKSKKEIKACVKHVNSYKTLLRHFDLKNICKFIIYVNKNDLIHEIYKIENYFTNISSINGNNLKEYYLLLLSKLGNNYETVYNYFKENRKKMFESSIKITTSDAHTLTDGPTIFITENVEKIARFYLRASDIAKNSLKSLFEVIKRNRIILNELDKIEKDEKERVDKLGDKFIEKNHSSINGNEYKFQNEFIMKKKHLKKKMELSQLLPVYIPNKEEHQTKWNKDFNEDAYSCNIDEEIVEEIMFLNIKDEWKILLLMGIGVFCKNNCVKYKEIMKKLAQNQNLYLIIASSDYIYGTNYQFCHGYLSKDLGNISQEKMIQAFGRVGRSKMQKTYTIRLRNDDLILKLFTKDENKPEVMNMNKLFVD